MGDWFFGAPFLQITVIRRCLLTYLMATLVAAGTPGPFSSGLELGTGPEQPNPEKGDPP